MFDIVVGAVFWLLRGWFRGLSKMTNVGPTRL